jgi:hypothetical protein
MSWFRLHANMIHHAVVWSLPPSTFKAWIGILCLAKEGEGIIPKVDEIAFQLRCGLSSAVRWTDELCDSYGLLERCGDGTFHPKNWEKHQFKSDNATTRVRAFRERRRNVSVTPPETDTDTEYRNRVQKHVSIAKKPIPQSGEWPNAQVFTESWRRHLKQRRDQPLEVVAQVLIGRNGSLDWDELARAHPAYCAYWDKRGWDFCPLTLLEWIDGGMLPPPADAVAQKESRAERRAREMDEAMA